MKTLSVNKNIITQCDDPRSIVIDTPIRQTIIEHNCAVQGEPMNVSVILAHPRPGSFNHAIAETAACTLSGRGHTPIVHDLYRERFDPLLPAGEIARNAEVDPSIALHCRELMDCGGILIVHPNWWGQPPAILKGWIDRVIRPGVAYEFSAGDSGEGVPAGLLAGKRAVVFNTSDTPAEREREVFGDPLESIWKQCVFDFCGVRDVYRRTFGVIVTSTAEERRAWLHEVESSVTRIFP